MKINIQIIFYSMYGHIYQLAEAIKKGAAEINEVDVQLYQVAELIPPEILEKNGAKVARERFAHIPIAKPAQLAEADAIILGTPTRYGNMCAQLRHFLDQTGSLWVKNALVGKVGSVFTSSGTQHGGQETTILTTHISLLALGLIIIGIPYLEKRLLINNEISGGSPFGASTVAGNDGSRQPTANELAIAEFQGKYVAQITRALKRGQELTN